MLVLRCHSYEILYEALELEKVTNIFLLSVVVELEFIFVEAK